MSITQAPTRSRWHTLLRMYRQLERLRQAYSVMDGYNYKVEAVAMRLERDLDAAITRATVELLQRDLARKGAA